MQDFRDAIDAQRCTIDAQTASLFAPRLGGLP
jgi:hypothetical protein